MSLGDRRNATARESTVINNFGAEVVIIGRQISYP